MKEAIKPFKKPLIALGILFVVYATATKIFPIINDIRAQKTPIVSIEASNEESYRQNAKIKKSDFKVYAIHESGAKSRVDADQFEISKEKPAKTGKITKVTVTMDQFSCEVKVKNDRKKLVSFSCGSPVLSDVQAVVYSNGELCFEGKGDILIFDEYPWKNYDGSRDNPITSLSFEKGVTPKNLDRFFSGISTLEYVKSIPESVESMEETFYGTSLTKAPDVSKCTKLLNMKKTYANCTMLTEIPPIPSSVKNTESMCENCTELQTVPDMQNAESLLNSDKMFMSCKKLTNAEVAPNVRTMNSMYQYCINLKEMPVIPDGVTEMDNAFSDDLSLCVLTNIPENVTTAQGCFKNCGKAEGTLVINATPENYSNFFQGAAVATTVDLQGSSPLLNAIANTAEDKATVNGNAPAKDAD